MLYPVSTVFPPQRNDAVSNVVHPTVAQQRHHRPPPQSVLRRGAPARGRHAVPPGEQHRPRRGDLGGLAQPAQAEDHLRDEVAVVVDDGGEAEGERGQHFRRRRSSSICRMEGAAGKRLLASTLNLISAERAGMGGLQRRSSQQTLS